MSRILSKFIVIVFVILFIVGFRSMLISDPTVSDAFKGLMSNLPFVGMFSEIACNVLGYQNSQVLVSSAGIVLDIAKLVVMALIQPTLTILASLVFLRLPSGLLGADSRERYMDGCWYRIKETLVRIAVAPFSAVLAGFLMTAVMDWAASKFGAVGSVLTGVATTVLAAGLAAIPMIILGTAVSVALLWRLLVTLLGGVLTTLTTILFSVLTYYAIVHGTASYIVGYLIAFILIMAAIDLAIQCFQQALGGYSYRR